MLEIFSRLAIALGLGLLIGLQRQRTDARLAGFRTFPLVALLGALCGLAAGSFGGWIVAGGFAALALVIIGGELPLLHVTDESPGITTEVAILVMFVLGAYLMIGYKAVGIVICGAVAVLLHLKSQMHSLARRIGDRDFTAIMQFALISLVILPVLPDRTYGPFDVLNPFRIWLMVVLIVAISLGGYIVYKLVGGRAGAWSTGLLGGLISSTATTVSLARRSKKSPTRPELAAFVILTASAVVFVRLAILIGMTAPPFLSANAVPFAAMFVVLGGFGWLSYSRRENGPSATLEQSNPTELKPAVLFGCVYAVILMAVAAANAHFGQRGLYVTAVISGLTDMDAITLSVTHLVTTQEIEPHTGWRLILTAAMANLGFKATTVALLGDRRLLGLVTLGFGAALAVGAMLLAFGS